MLLELAQLPEVQRLESLATRFETPCDPEASMVWRRWSPAGGPPLVLLHGGSGSWNHWLRNIDALAQHYTVYAADLPGCGESGLPPGGRDADSIYETVATGIEKLIGGVAVEMVAFSFGTLVAGFIAANYPELVKRLHLVGCAGLGLSRPRLFLQSLAKAEASGGSQSRSNSGRNDEADSDADGEAQETDGGESDGEARGSAEAVVRHNMLALMVQHPQTLDDQALSLHYASLKLDRLRRRRLSRTPITIELQPRWRCPVRAIWGEGDILIRNDAPRLREALSGCNLRDLTLIADAGHWVQYERAEAFNAELLRNLAAED
jgi:2-hydroxy-6-oxonona-2,4-dienedioate hydrolase